MPKNIALHFGNEGNVLENRSKGNVLENRSKGNVLENRSRPDSFMDDNANNFLVENTQ